jgi:type II secretory pathway component PulK
MRGGPGTRGAAVVVALVALTVLGIAVAARGGEQEMQFPHERHERLFPLCTGCHEGVPEGASRTRTTRPTWSAGSATPRRGHRGWR